MAHVLVVYGTRTGHAAAIANRIADSLRGPHVAVGNLATAVTQWTPRRT